MGEGTGFLGLMWDLLQGWAFGALVALPLAWLAIWLANDRKTLFAHHYKKMIRFSALSWGFVIFCGVAAVYLAVYGILRLLMRIIELLFRHKTAIIK